MFQEIELLDVQIILTIVCFKCSQNAGLLRPKANSKAKVVFMEI